ncbi:MAG: tail sheath stabilizer and completion protein [Patescibacteria group bacterium]|nr:tail sheath stabilizer and completion protein [Patescibacteria group bacterium]
MSPTPFYFSSIRSLVIGFLSLFNNIRIQRFNPNGTVKETIKVPVAWGSGDKSIIITDFEDINRQLDNTMIKIVLPRISVSLDSIDYDNVRMTQLNNFVFKNLQTNQMQKIYTPVPYNFTFSVSVSTKYIDDGFQILEQILPYYRPFYTITIKNIRNLEILKDVQIVLNGVSYEDTYEGAVQDERVLNWNMTFVAHHWIWPPISGEAKVIKKAIVNFLNMSNNQQMSEVIVEVDPLSANWFDPHTIKTTINEIQP